MADFVIWFFTLIIGVVLGYSMGETDGRRDVYKGTVTCQTLLNGNIECFQTSAIKEK